MSTQFSDNDVSSFLKGLIELGGGNVVDDSPDKYIRMKSDNKPVTLSADGRNVPLAIYGTKATDAIIINPFSEGDTDSTKQAWFYSSRNIVLSALIVKIMKTLLTVGAASHKKKKDEEPASMEAIKWISKYVTEIDEKMVKEFDTISKELHNFMNIHYNKGTKRGEVKCVIFTQNQRKAFPSVRAKTWGVFEGILSDILGISELGELDYIPETLGIPAFESFAHILVNIYERLQEALKLIGREDNVAALKSHLKYLPDYFARAKWCATPTAVVPQQQVMVPAPTVQTPSMYGAMPGAGVPVVTPAPTIVPWGQQIGSPVPAPTMAPYAYVNTGYAAVPTQMPAPAFNNGYSMGMNGAQTIPMPKPKSSNPFSKA